MKKLILVLLSFCTIFSFISNGQERNDEVRKQLQLSMDGQSEKLTNVSGWSRLENQVGKYWKQSDLISRKSYLPCCPNDGFEYIQTFKYTLESQVFYIFSIKYIDNQMRIFVISSSSFEKLKNIITASDGQTYNSPDIKSCNYQVLYEGESFDFEVYIKSKELIRKLLLNEEEGYFHQFSKCDGYSLFLINSQVLKGENIVRFNIIPRDNKLYQTTPLADDYFELKRSEFEKLFNFSKYDPKKEKEAVIELEKQKKELIIKKLKEKYDNLNSVGDININYVREHIETFPKLKTSIDTTILDTSELIEGDKFSVVVGASGKIIKAPKQNFLFQQLSFTPGTIEVDAEINKGEKPIPLIFARNMEIDGEFKMCYDYSGHIPVTTRQVIIIKLKKNKDDKIEVLNNYFTDIEFMKVIRPEIKLSEEFTKYPPGKYYFYYEMKTTKWKLKIYTERDGSHYDDKERETAGYFYPQTVKKEIKEFNSANIDNRCP